MRTDDFNARYHAVVRFAPDRQPAIGAVIGRILLFGSIEIERPLGHRVVAAWKDVEIQLRRQMGVLGFVPKLLFSNFR